MSAAVLVLVLASACSGSSGTSSNGGATSSAAPAPRSGGVVDYPLQAEPVSLAPFATDAPEVGHQIFEGLVQYDTLPDGTVVTAPCLAESWSANGDATVWTFRLRRGVRFQAPVGREVTAADVVACFRYGADPRTGSPSAYMYACLAGTDAGGQVLGRAWSRYGVEAPGRYTVRFRLKQPFATFPDTLGGSFAWVYPVDHVRKVGRERFAERPVGTGPFVVSRWVRGDSLDLVRNPTWWNAASGQPYLDGVHLQTFPSVTAELLAFQRGVIDFTWVPKGQVAVSRSLPQVRSGEWRAVVLPQAVSMYIGFNLEAPAAGGDAGLPLRQAIACAIDRRDLVGTVGDGVDIPQTGLVPPIFPGWREQPPQTCDVARARRLYEQGGSPQLRLVCPDDRFAVAVGGWLRRSCAAAGISVEVRPMQWDEYVALFMRGSAPAVYLFGWTSDYPAPDNFVYDLFLGTSSPYTSGTHYSDPDVDRLLTLARSTADAGRHLDLLRRAAVEIAADTPVIPLYESADFRLLSARLGGFTPDPMYGVDMWKLWVR